MYFFVAVRTLEGSTSGVPRHAERLIMESVMSKISFKPLEGIDGYLGACLVDSDSGMMMGSHGGGPVNLELAAAGNTEVIRAKRKTMSALGLSGKIEDILITLSDQYHLIRPLAANDAMFIYVVIDRTKAKLAMARHVLKNFETALEFK